MPFLLRLLLVALAGISLAGARFASQHSGARPGETSPALHQPAALLRVASQQ